MNSWKRFKKISVLAMVLALAVSMLAGCSGSQNSGSAAAAEPQNRLEKILADGKLQVIMEPYFAPYEFVDSSKSGQDQYQGADVQLAKYIADYLGVELEIVPLEWTAVLTGVSTGKYDMAISGMGYTAERAEAMELSDSYYDEESSHGFVIKKEDIDKYPDLASFKGAKIAYQKGSLQEMYTNDQVEDVQGMPFDSVQNAILALQTGKADAVAVSYDNGELFVDANPDLAMATPKFEGTMDRTVVACPKGETELIEKVNEAIAEVKDQGLFVQWWDEAIDQAKSLGISE
jgi:polar amino acid transport system substrate-binding protein